MHITVPAGDNVMPAKVDAINKPGVHTMDVKAASTESKVTRDVCF